ncbi:putative ATP/GTP-binding protein [Actinacidiphila reveromycinica]|uniref:Putative ATP/GTP-binding protein n=1 Tax=Actinacidiphila reveromycinica TaxID=659352 RepID=A0A7U3VR86_9ACTN|nr:ATP/GTP-binding protein [Streptomyces sp. SN-593]BBB00510.1 putative ATP/GTP-binding protein [Streptomyces sp. SN-593]
MDAKDRNTRPQGAPYGQPAPPPRPPNTPVPRPAAPPPAPAQAPPLSAVERWLRTPRVSDAPGIYAYGHVPRPPDDPDRMTDRRLIGGAVLALLCWFLLWSLMKNGYVPLWKRPLTMLTPGAWWHGSHPSRMGQFAAAFYECLWLALLTHYFAKIGSWREVGRRYLSEPRARAAAAAAIGVAVWVLSDKNVLPLMSLILPFYPPSSFQHGQQAALRVQYEVDVIAALVVAVAAAKYGRWADLLRGRTGPGGRQPYAPGAVPKQGPGEPAALPAPAEWAELRAAGYAAVADRLAQDVRTGRMNDVDCARVRRAWQAVHQRHEGAQEFADGVLRLGGAAMVHPSGARDVPRRTADHDLLGGQVRIGTGVEDKRNGYQYRGAGIALDPGVLGTGLLAVGPPGAGKSRLLMRPVVESLCLQALAGRAAVVAVAGADVDLGPAEAYDVVISLADPASRYDLDLYGGTTDPDTAAWLLAEALTDGPETDQRRAATALGQLLGPYAAAHGRFPPVPVLRELLEGLPHAFAALREAVDAVGMPGLVRELDARERQSARPGDIGTALADRIGVLDRPAFAGFFDTSGRSRPFAMHALAHPLRVRVELPERGHAEASRILVRLLLAQFTAAVSARRDRSLFACIVVDDAAQALSEGTLRALPSLRGLNAGALFGLRSLDALPEGLRGAVVGAVGCRMVFAGVSPRDGRFFSETWGTMRVQTRDVTRTPDQSGGLPRRLSRGVRRLFTGEVVTTESVTVREVERERWSAADLSHQVPVGHAVVSLTTTTGEHAPPVLVDLRT